MARAGKPDIFLVNREDALRAVASRLAEEETIAIDIESNGMHAYKAGLCVVQLAARGSVVVVDPLATPLTALGPLLASERTVKLLHDVSFDARILAEAGIPLRNVQDTAVAARMLGRSATGLASLLSAELGVSLDKAMQHHDWGRRPLDRVAIQYLAGDVVHLETLAARLFAEVSARGILDEVATETAYRLGQATTAAGDEDSRPPYLRLKGIDKLPEADLAVLRRVADVRETKARELDAPPYKVLAPDVLLAIAKDKPRTFADLAKIKGATQGRRAASISDALLAAVALGIADGAIPDEDRARLVRPRLSGSVVRARKARVERLTRWRRQASTARQVDEQVVLPGHCLQDLADLDDASMQSIAAVPGIGAFRVARDGEAILAALASPPAELSS
jgi:ribonuclease D